MFQPVNSVSNVCPSDSDEILHIRVESVGILLRATFGPEWPRTVGTGAPQTPKLVIFAWLFVVIYSDRHVHSEIWMKELLCVRTRMPNFAQIRDGGGYGPMGAPKLVNFVKNRES